LYSTDGATWYKAQQKDIDEPFPNETFATNYPFFYFQGDSVLGMLPATAGTARITYYKLPTQLSNEDDNLPVPMRAYTSSFVDYALSQCFYLDNKEDKGDRYSNRANTLLGMFRDQIASRHKSGAEGVSIVEELNGEDDFWW